MTTERLRIKGGELFVFVLDEDRNVVDARPYVPPADTLVARVREAERNLRREGAEKMREAIARRFDAMDVTGADLLAKLVRAEAVPS